MPDDPAINWLGYFQRSLPRHGQTPARRLRVAGKRNRSGTPDAASSSAICRGARKSCAPFRRLNLRTGPSSPSAASAIFWTRRLAGSWHERNDLPHPALSPRRGRNIRRVLENTSGGIGRTALPNHGKHDWQNPLPGGEDTSEADVKTNLWQFLLPGDRTQVRADVKTIHSLILSLSSLTPALSPRRGKNAPCLVFGKL
jgi:hypothetical protein